MNGAIETMEEEEEAAFPKVVGYAFSSSPLPFLLSFFLSAVSLPNCPGAKREHSSTYGIQQQRAAVIWKGGFVNIPRDFRF